MATPVSSISVEFITSIIAIFISIFGFIWSILKYGIKLENRLTRLETKTELWWNTVAEAVKGQIQQPIHFRKDELLDRFPNISDAELKELKQILIEELPALKKVKDKLVTSYAVWLARIGIEEYDREHLQNLHKNHFKQFINYLLR